jgi:hypothetical protein
MKMAELMKTSFQSPYAGISCPPWFTMHLRAGGNGRRLALATTSHLRGHARDGRAREGESADSSRAGATAERGGGVRGAPPIGRTRQLRRVARLRATRASEAGWSWVGSPWQADGAWQMQKSARHVPPLAGAGSRGLRKQGVSQRRFEGSVFPSLGREGVNASRGREPSVCDDPSSQTSSRLKSAGTDLERGVQPLRCRSHEPGRRRYGGSHQATDVGRDMGMSARP